MIPIDVQPDEPWYIRYAQTHPVSENIDGDGNKSPYLMRWHLIRKNPILNIYLHHFIGDDERPMHDHPWASLAKQLDGTLYEIYDKDPSDNLSPVSSRYVNPGRWSYRSSKFMHKIRLADKGKGAWTIFITGPKLKQWGFKLTTGWQKSDIFFAKNKEKK